MHAWVCALVAVALAPAADVARASPLPEGVTAMLDAAADDPDMLEAVVKAALRAHSDSAAEIKAYVTALTARKEAGKTELAASNRFLEGWTGEGELGGSISTGNSEERGVFASLSLSKETATWGHQLEITLDHQREGEETTKDRYFAAYTISRNFTPRFYAAGTAWGERDRFAGYNYRFSESLALGYRLIDQEGLELRVEGGPGLRQTDYLDVGHETTIAGYAGGYLSWEITPWLELTQSLNGYLDTRNSTLLAETGLTAKLKEGILARASYEFRHEDDPPEDRERTDTTSRVTVVFSF